MVDVNRPLIVDGDTGAGTEPLTAVNLVMRASGGSTELLGSAASAASIPVVVASDQAAIEVDLAANNDVTTELAGTTAVAAMADADANPSVLPIGSYMMAFNGTTWDRVRGAVATGLEVDIVQSVALTVDLGANNDVVGTLTHDNAAPAATNLGALTGLANAAAPTYTEGNQVLLSTDLSGALRITGAAAGTEFTTDVAGGAGPWAGGTTVMIRDDALSTQETADGDWTVMRANARGAQWVELDPTSAVVVDLGANNDVTTEFAGSTAVATMADADANPDVLPVGGYMMGYNGATWDRVRTANTGRLQVDVVTGGGSDTPTNPVISGANATTPVNVAAGAEGNLDTPEATSKKLVMMEVWSSVPFRCRVYTVDNAVESTDPVGMGGAPAFGTYTFKPTHRDYVTLGATAGLDAFRAEVKNLDDSLAADFYMVAHYED
jgi:hypothetical protein